MIPKIVPLVHLIHFVRKSCTNSVGLKNITATQIMKIAHIKDFRTELAKAGKKEALLVYPCPTSPFDRRGSRAERAAMADESIALVSE